MAAPETGSVAVLAEKPSVARDIARVLGAGTRGEGYLHGNGYVVTWAIGHLAALAQPHEINPQWRSWRRDLLPMLPSRWPLVVYEKTKDQFETVQRILNSPKISRVVCATDAGREGELIFRYIYEAAGCAKPVNRLWISSLTPDAIRKGFDSLKPAAEYDGLADAARGRSRADWLVGMNLSRAYSLTYGEDLSVGRVQTPTLAMVVERELAVRRFVPEDYLEVLATFHPRNMPADTTYQGTWLRERTSGGDKESLQQAMRLPADGEEAKRIVERARSGTAAIESLDAQTQRMPPPLLYDLTELQRHANRLFGFSAQKTLDLAQALYERHKLISYPRTDSRHLSQDVARTLPRVVGAVEAPYREWLAAGTGERPLGRRFVDDSKVTDHHAIIPTASSPERASLSPEEKKIYDLVCRRLLSAWHEDHIWSVTTVITAITNGATVDRYHTSGSAVQQVGWKVLDLAPPAKPKKGKGGGGGAGTGTGAGEPGEETLPAGLTAGQAQDVVEVEAVKKKTRAPKRFTEGTLLTAMETAGKTLDEKELSDAMKETGLGTPATRAAIIEVLLKREYIVRNGKSLEATDKGIRLIEVVHPEVKSPAMTGQWEAYLHRIHRGAAQLGPFMAGIEKYVREVVGKVGQVPAAPRGGRAGANGASAASPARPEAAAVAPDRSGLPAPGAPVQAKRTTPVDVPPTDWSDFAAPEEPVGRNAPPAGDEPPTERSNFASPPALAKVRRTSPPAALSPQPEPDDTPPTDWGDFAAPAESVRRNALPTGEAPPTAADDAPPAESVRRNALPAGEAPPAQRMASRAAIAPRPEPDDAPPTDWGDFAPPAESVRRNALPAGEAPPAKRMASRAAIAPRPEPDDAPAKPVRRNALPAGEEPPPAPDDGPPAERSDFLLSPAPARVRRTSPPVASGPSGYQGRPLGELLHEAFGFASFRAGQEEVCRAVIAGKDVLLVMPTGSGKSLCYQLPGIARGGTTLVISPLIALMEDQVAKLKERGFAVARIHSGRDRADSRQACIDYLNGALQFLFIAPERLRVSGFPEMLAKRKPWLVAIDEAHCISQWGHDFRPDYRMLGQYIPTLRPAPVIGLTATATPIVQNDIVAQLGLEQPGLFIQGFRRPNLAVEVVEVPPSRRADLACELLLDEERRPAIVYTPTRAQAEALAEQFGRHFASGAYHAGLDAEHRKRVQREFQEGSIEVMVATIAFGMGIDKPDVRTVIHTALPGSLEAYYQEIGRAGRDGAKSRTLLMHSYADRRTHDFFFERDYPDPTVLDRIFERLTGEPVEKETLRQRLRMDADEFDKALEKLWIHGGASIDFAENISRGHDRWRESYIAQSDQKQQQLNLMLRYAEGSECRMAALVRHFGDLADSRKACGICDFCDPASCIGQRFRGPTGEEKRAAARTIEALRGTVRATGRLHGEICPHGELTRDDFEEVLGAMARAGLIRLMEAAFEKDGKSIPFRKAVLTPAGEDVEEDQELELQMRSAVPAAARVRKGKKKAAKGKRAGKKAPGRGVSGAARLAPPGAVSAAAEEDRGLEESLRRWRLAEAKRLGVPAFRVLTDRALRAIAESRPATAAELLAIPGIGISTVEKYGAQLYRLVQAAGG